MTSYSELLGLAHSASESLKAIEDAQAAQVVSLFARYENGLMTYGQLRIELLRQAKAGFTTGGSVAVEHVASVARASGFPKVGIAVMQDSEVLDKLLDDLRRNLEAYRDSGKETVALRRLKFRTGLSIQAAVRMGFRENQISAAQQIRDSGLQLRKMWLANFVNNTPCHVCASLHGQDVPLSEDFDHGGEHDPKVFMGDLQGPPRHPNCHCYMLVYVVDLEMNTFVPQPLTTNEEKYMSAKDVRKLPRNIYTAAVTTLRVIAGILQKAVKRG